MQPTAKTLILDLLSASRGEAVAVRRLAVACALFDISENSVRVTLVRLSSAGLIEAAGRGAYRLSGDADELAREVATWRTAEKRVRAWEGAYVVVHDGVLGRSDRAAVKRRTRALQMLGFGEIERGLSIRPDNLEGGVDAVRARLHSLGLEKEASVFRASGFEAEQEARARGLWDGATLTASYKSSRAELASWLTRAPSLEPDVAAREAFLLGGAAIRQVVFDPLLPPPFVDVEARRSFVETVRRFDRAGRVIWQRFFGFRLGSAAPSTVQPSVDNAPPGGWTH